VAGKKARKGNQGWHPKSPKPASPTLPRRTGWHLITVDQEPLRRAATSECGRAFTRLEKARGDWNRFETEDKPAFGRWMAATFGAVLTRLRENDARIAERENLIREVKAELAWGKSRSHRAAYAQVLRRRAHPSEAPPTDSAQPNPGFAEEGPAAPDPFEQELLFEEFMRMFLGLDPDQLSETKYEKLFAEFKANVFDRINPDSELPRDSPPPAPPPSRHGRIKEIYRVLVRRLHPDTRTHSGSGVSPFWHEVQQAYRTGNLERLEMLLALTDLESGQAGDQTSLAQMRAVVRELRRAFNLVQKNLRGARKDSAWNFSRTQDRTLLQARLRNQFEEDLAVQGARLQDLEALIARWTDSRRSPRRTANTGQAEFSW
jgi:hypothetical protein